MVPALRAALLCETLLTEADGVMSAVRMFSRLHLSPGAMFDATLLVMMVSVAPDDSPHHHVLVDLESSTGEVLGRQRFAVAAPLEANQSFSLVVPFRFEAPAQDTTYWLRLAYDDAAQRLTRFPIQFTPRPVKA